MIQKIKNFAAETGLGIAAVYAFLQIPAIKENFQPEVMIVIRQALISGFGACLMINPKGLITLGQEFTPKIIEFFRLFVPDTLNKKDDEKNNPDL